MKNLNKILNINDSEWGRVLVAWSLNFLLRFGFIVGWTVGISIFLSKIGIYYLPIFFLANAILAIIGTFIYRLFCKKIRKELLITFSVIVAAAFLFASLLFLNTNIHLFLLFLIITESILLSQTYIFVSLFYEDLFTPIESQRTFPIIESSEVIGAIAGGLVLSLFSGQLATYKFIVIWIIAIILILPIILLFNTKTLDIPILENEEDRINKNKLKNLSEAIKEIKKIPFLKSVIIIILFNWIIINILEFQYTKAIQSDVLAHHLDSMSYESDIAKKLGTLHVIFNTGALFVQLIFASRIMTSLGTVSSMLLHPLLNFLNFMIMTLRFNFITASITRGSFELTNLIFNNAYYSSYYGFKHEDRDDAKELIQGIIKPLGAIVGTIFIATVQNIFIESISSFILNISMVFISLGMAIFCSDLRRKYTFMCEQNLSSKLDLHTRLNAVEILSQNGHTKIPLSLTKILKRETESNILKEKILHTIGKKSDPENIHAITDMLDNKDEDLRLAATNALMHFESLEEKIFNQAFTKYYTIESIKMAIKKEKNTEIKEKLLKVLYKISSDDLTKFVIDQMRNEKSNKSEIIKTMGMFNDPNIMIYIEPYINSKNPHIKAACIIALWQFERMRPTLSHNLKELLESKQKEKILVGIETVGILKMKSFNDYLMKYMKSDDKIIRDAVLEANNKMRDENEIKKVKQLLAIHEIAKILKNNKNKTIEMMDKPTLEKLSDLYKKLDAHIEYSKIQTVLRVAEQKTG